MEPIKPPIYLVAFDNDGDLSDVHGYFTSQEAAEDYIIACYHEDDHDDKPLLVGRDEILAWMDEWKYEWWEPTSVVKLYCMDGDKP